MLPRPALLASIQAALTRAPVESANSFDLEDPISRARLDEPLPALGELGGTVVIDAVQRHAELFPLLRQTSESLAARFHPHPAGECPAPAGGASAGSHPAVLLGDARPRPRAAVEWG